MGYTHYCYKAKELDQTKWDNFITDFEKVLPFFEHYLDNDPSDNQYLQHTSEKLWFNGIGEDGHETFALMRVEDKNSTIGYGEENSNTPYFTFCKTAQKPYDIAVTSALIIAKYHFEKDVKVLSDGDTHDWIDAKSLCQEELGYGEDFKIPENGEKGAHFTDCEECENKDGILCEEHNKPCEVGTHDIDEYDEESHSTGTLDWGICKKCGYGVSQYYRTEYVGEALTQPRHHKDIIKEFF